MAKSLQTTFTATRAAQRGQAVPDWASRASRLRTLASLLREHREAIIAAIDADFEGRPREETELLELFPALSGIKHALKHGHRWMQAKRRFASFWFLPARTQLRAQPLGVIGVIVPWNYPLYLAVGPLTDALCAGNHVLLKMSEFSPCFAMLFAELIERYFPAGEVRVITGDAEVAKAFAALPLDHLLFTGSTAVGHHVMRAAAANLTPVTLELGGKSPAIIGPAARFEHAVERIVFGKCVNAGQTCIAPDYVLLPRRQQQAFIASARKAFARLYPNFAHNQHYASIISAQHFTRLHALRDQAIASGASAHELTQAIGQGRRMPLTLLTGVAADADIMREEIFGPLLPLVAYDSLDEALAIVAARPHPLALYLFDDHAATQAHVLARVQAGGVSINDTLFHIAQHHLPFGGVGNSGFGAYHGEHGFRRMSHMQPVFRQARCNGVGLLNPPYGRRFKRLLKLMLRG
ncbi:MAG: coniferyl aldehyde dehydrogenase [Xanthomonadales bacterium]|nr:coniferyl aldehyde dehydrogenase [Xanthomonadales bacterium]